MDQRKSPKKKLQFEVPSKQLHGHLDPRSSEQLRKRRPTPATLFLLNDQTSPDDDRDGEHGEGAEGRLGHSPRKGGHHSSYTPPTMSQMQTLVELHLHATEEEDEEDLDDDEDDRSAGGEDDNGASGGDGHHASLILHVPPGAVAPHGEKGGARGGLHGDAGEPMPGTTAEPEAGSPPSGGAQGDFVAASGGGYGEGKEPGNAEEVANVTFEPRRRVTWAHGPGEAAGGPPHLASPPIPTGDKIVVPEAETATTTEPDAGANPPSGAPGLRQEVTPVTHESDVTHVTHADAQRAVEGCSRSDSEPGAGQDGETGALAGTDADERSAGGPDGQPRVKAHVRFEARQPDVGSAAEAGIQFDVRSAAKPDAESATEPGAQSGAHVDAHVVTEVGTGPTVN
ncbi:uncharacterized protein LOC144951367 isoform X2 [Lampetra fluviatilis]